MLVAVSPVGFLRPVANLALHDLRSIVLPIAMAPLRASHLNTPARCPFMRMGFRVRGMIPAASVSRRSACGADTDEVRDARNEDRLLLSRVYRSRPAARCRNESTSLRHDLHLDPTASADDQVSAIFTMLLNVFTCLL